MVSYVVPLARYPKTYNGHPLQYAAVSSEKSYVSVHLMSIYADAESQRWFVDSYKATGKKLDMGKACVRFKDLDDLPARPHRGSRRAYLHGGVDTVLRGRPFSQETRQTQAPLGTPVTWAAPNRVSSTAAVE